jgi:hypothetical protein
MDCRRPELVGRLEQGWPELDILHVALVADQSFLSGLLVTMLSMTRHLQNPDKCVIHVLCKKRDHGRNDRCYPLL